MKKYNPAAGLSGLVLALALGLCNPVLAAELVTTDIIHGHPGVLQGATGFVPSDRPHAGSRDYAIDLTTAGGGVLVADASFLNVAAANDTLTFAFWVKKYDMADSSAFWVHAATEDRALQAHTPWGNNRVYFDTAGCCDPLTQRIDAAISDFPEYTDATWWDRWHHWVFLKNGSDKQIWIDGQLFLQGSSTFPLPADITYMFIGGTAPGSSLMRGQMDDFAIFANALSPSDIASLFNGTSPEALGGANQLLAYWDFNDAPVFSPPLVGPLGFSITVNDVGTSVMDPNTVALTLDGTSIVPTSVVKLGDITSVEYLLPDPPFPPGSSHTFSVSMDDAGGQTFSTSGTFVVSHFGLLRSDMALPPASVNKNLPGFKLRTYQVENPIPVNGVQVAEDILAGRYGPNVAWLDDVTGVDARGYFTWPHVINFDTQETPGTTSGRFAAPDYYDYMFPGIPGDLMSYHYFACEIYAALEFTAPGLYTMAVNSDDCFATTSGPNPLDVLGAVRLGSFDSPTGRAAADTAFRLFVQEPGLYGFRTVFQQGGGLGSLEWFMVNPDGVRVLINDVTNAIPAYQWLPTLTAAYVRSVVPDVDATAAGPSRVQAIIVDGTTAVNPTSVSLRIDDQPVTATITRVGNETTVTYAPDPLFTAGASHKATLVYTDGANVVSRDWSFTVVPSYTRDIVNNHVGVPWGMTGFVPAADRPYAASDNYAVDTSGGGVFVTDASFLNEATASDTLTFAFWVRKFNMNASSAFWAISPSSSDVYRGFQAHVPWSNNRVYFDTAGCCDALTQRIDAPMSDFPGYTDVSWWDDWHHWVFFKNGPDKQIWIDGELFLQGSSTDPLPVDMTSLWLGRSADDNIMHGLLDDFAVYGTALSPADIQALATGTAPNALPANTMILAYWSFNDALAVAPPTVALDPDGNLIYTGTLQHADAITGDWVDVPGATSPYVMPKTDAMKFYRSWR